LALGAQLASGDGMSRLDLEVVVGEDDMNNYHYRQIAQSATCRYLIYSEAHFEVFHPAGATRCTDWGEIWHGGGDTKVPSSMPYFTPIGTMTRVWDPKN